MSGRDNQSVAGDRAEQSARAVRAAQPVLVFLAFAYAIIFALLNLAQAVGHRLTGLVSGVERLTHIDVWQGNAALPALLGVFMLVLVYQLWCKKRAALVVLSAFIVAQAVVQAFHGDPRVETALTVMLGVLPLLAISQFPGKPDPGTLKKLKIAAPVVVMGFFAYGIAGFYFFKNTLGLQGENTARLAYRAISVVGGNAGLRFHGAGIVFRDSLVVVALFAFVMLIAMLFRPYREEHAQTVAEHARATELVKRYGSDSLSYFNTRSDKAVFFEDGDSFLAYRRVGDMVCVSADPVGPTTLIPEILGRFRQYCGERGWRFFLLGANADYASYYAEAGMKTFALGEEAVVDVDQFSLDGRRVRKLRQAVNKLEKSGMTMEFMYNASIPSHMRHELMQISVDWRGDSPETGFSMGLGRLLSPEDPDCLLAVANDADGKPIGFLYFVPMYPHQGYSLDITRTAHGTPNALSEFMLVKTAQFLKAEGYRYMSMHFLALSQHYRDDRTEPGSPAMRLLAKALDHGVPVVSMYNFDKKFFPLWKQRAIIYESVFDYPAIAVSAVAAEKALKLTRRANRER